MCQKPEFGNEQSPNHKRQLLVAFLAVFAVLAFIGCKDRDSDNESREAAERNETGAASTARELHRDQIKLSSEIIERYGIQVKPVTKQMIVPTFVAPASVSFNTEMMTRIGSAVTGRVVKLNVRLGDTVKEGDILLVVESSELGEAQSDYLQRKSAVVVAAMAIEPTKAAYMRGKMLYERNQGIALGELQKREAEYNAAQGALQSAQAAITAAENKLRLLGMNAQAIKTLAQSGKVNAQYPIAAFTSGQVVEREVTLGELVGPDRPSLLTLADTTRLWVLADVPEAKLNDFAIHSKAIIKIAVIPQQTMEGKVSFVAPSLDPATHSAQVRIEISNAQGSLRPGMFAQAEIAAMPVSSGKMQATLVVPEPAIVTVDRRPAVFVPVLNEQGTFAKREVAVGPAVNGMVPIVSGLREGDPVVVAGTFVLKAELGKGTTEDTD